MYSFTTNTTKLHIEPDYYFPFNFCLVRKNPFIFRLSFISGSDEVDGSRINSKAQDNNYCFVQENVTNI